MSDCRRAADIEWDAYLVDPTDPQWDAFRAHFPSCRDCAATVAGWTRLEETLRAAANPAGATHPSAEALLRYHEESDRAGDSGHSGRMALHVAGCRACRDALTALEGFDFDALIGPPVRRPAAETTPWLGARFATWLADRLAMPAPAAVATVAALAVVAVVWSLAPFDETAVPSQTDLADSAPAVTPAPAPTTTVPAPEPRLAAASEPDPEPKLAAASEPEPAPSEPIAPRAVAQQAAAETARHETPAPVVAEAIAAEPVVAEIAEAVAEAPLLDPVEALWAEANAAPAEEVQLAMAEMHAPLYAAPSPAVGPGRVQDVLRAELPEVPVLQALAPEHQGRTFRTSPTLYWSASSASSAPIVFTLVDEREDSAPVEVELGPVSEAGIYAVSLEERGIELEVGRRYQWFVVVPEHDDDGPAVIAGGAIERVEPDAEQVTAWGVLGTGELAHGLANDGYWYDAIDLLSRWQADTARAALLEQAGLAAP